MSSNVEEESSHRKDLAKDLEKSIHKSLQEFRSELKAKRQENKILSPLLETRKKSKKVTTILVQEEIVTFNFRENQDLEHFKDLGGDVSKLQNWRVECRQRETLMLDMFYQHPNSRRKFRSIPEVVNYILPKDCPKLKTRESRKKVKQGTSQLLLTNNTEDKGCENLEAQNLRILPESILGSVIRKRRGRPRKIMGMEETQKKLKESSSSSNHKRSEKKENNIEVENTSSDEILPNLPIMSVNEENMMLPLQQEQTQQEITNNDNVVSTMHEVRNDSSGTLLKQPEMQLATETMNAALLEDLEDIQLIEKPQVINDSSQIVPYQPVQERASLEPELLETLQKHSFPVEDWMYDDL